MKYIKPPEFADVKEFTAYYKRVESEITELLTKDPSAKSAAELNKKLQQALNAAVSYLTKINKDYTQKDMPKAFTEGQQELTKSPAMTKAEASEMLQRQGFRYSKKAFSSDCYIELQSATKAATDGLQGRVNGIIKYLHKNGQDSVYNVQQAILNDLQTNGLLTVNYKNGAKQPISAYAAMAARSARIETVNIGAIGRALENGTDLVKMSTMPQCCKFCGAYQDKVYSISGKDKRFPALFKTVLIRGYALPHPNCRHQFIPYYEDIEDPEDVKDMIQKSRIKYEKDGSLADVRTAKDIEGYRNWQAGNRQLNAEARAYSSYLEYCKTNGIEPRYKTIGGFRRARRAEKGTTAYENSHFYKKLFEKVAINEKDDIIKVAGAKNNPDEQLHGELRYPAIRKDKYDVERIAKNTGRTVEEIQYVKNYLFMDKHDLGNGKIDYFAPDDEIAKSWDRLRAGEDIRPHDLTLINHELEERRLVQSGLTQSQAHDLANKKYNYQKEVYNAKNKKS